MNKPGRNDPCHCGSGKKYKRCHMEADLQAQRQASGHVEAPPTPQRQRNNTILKVLAVLIVLTAIVLFAMSYVNWSLAIGIGGLILLGGYALVRDPPPPNKDSSDPSGINFGR